MAEPAALAPQPDPTVDGPATGEKSKPGAASEEPAAGEPQQGTTARILKIGGEAVAFAVARFGPQAARLEPTAAALAEPLLVDSELTNAAELAGKVAVVRRGGVQFFEKARRVQAAGAVAMVVVNTEDAPSPMGDVNKEAGDTTIPCICVGNTDGERLLLRGGGGGPPAVQFAYETRDTKLDLVDLEENIAKINGPDEELLPGVAWFRKLLSGERNPPIDEVIQSGVVPRLVELLGCDGNPQLQNETAWALCDIVSGTAEHCQVVIDGGAVPIFVKLLSSPSDDVREQSVLALGNIAGDSPRCRDLVLGAGAMAPLLAQVSAPLRVEPLFVAT